MREFAESFGVVVKATGGLALLVALPAIPVVLLFGGLMAVGRGTWGRGTINKKWAREVLTYETDETTLAVARDILRYG